MSAGVPLYLVSSCGSADEFVAAFRRYADRTGLFVPVNDPLPTGRRGRIALALKDGGVMIEGEAEVIASSQRPSGIHARVGMTLKWLTPDEPSKTVIAELEKARLAMKPSPPSVPPRHADIPAEPRAVPPAPGGRIDAANALAECVMIGDLASFGGGASAEPSAPIGPGKFVIPSIPPTGRAKAPTTPPALTRPRTPSTQVPVIKPITPPVGVKPKPDDAAEILATPTAGVPALKPATPPKATTIGVAPPMPVAVTSRLTPAGGIVRIPPAAEPNDTIDDDVAAILATPTGGVPAPNAKPTTLGVSPLARSPKDESSHPKMTRIGFPAIKLPAMEAPAVIVAVPPKDADPPPNASPFMRATPPQPLVAVVPPKPSGPPMPRQPTPFAPLPIVRLPAASDVDPEATDLTSIPASDEPRSLGVSIVTAIVPEASEPTRQEPPLTESELAAAEQSGPPSRSGGMRASQLMAAIGADDWTMAPGEAAPKILPAQTVETMDSQRATEQMDALPKPTPGPILTPDPDAPDDWTMTADPSAASGWSEPSKVDIPPLTAPKGNRLVDVASAEPLNAVEWEDKPTGIGEPLVEIDPSLMPTTTSTPRASTPPPIPPPLAPMPPQAPMMMMMAAGPPLPPPPLGPMPPQLHPPMSSFGPTGPIQPLGIPTPLPGSLRASDQVPVYDADPLAMFGGPRPPDPMESTSLLTVPKRKRGLVIVLAAAGVALVAGVIAIFAFGHHDSKPTTTPVIATVPVTPRPGSAAAASGSAEPAVAPTPTPPPPQVIASCKLDVTSVPDGAEIWLADAQLGVTPTTLELPCGVEAKLQLKHARATLVRSVTPASDTPTLVVRFAAPPPPSVMMRMTSTPPGATITLGGRVVGVTPTMIHMPASGASITFSKDGFTPDTEHVAAKPNGTLGVVLKRAPIRQRSH